MSARAQILARLRAARGDARPAAPQVGAWYAQTGDDPATRAQRLQTLLEAAHAQVLRATPANWAIQVAEHLLQAGVTRLLLPGDGTEATLLAAELGRRAPAVHARPFDQPYEDLRDTLFDATDAGFSVADCAIAATGTLVLKSSPAQPRTLSLVPHLHVALIDARRIHADLYAASQAEGWAGNLPTNLIMVSGPSKTADIQQVLAYGAHGPRAMLVVIVAKEA